MPGECWTGPLPPLQEAQRVVAGNLERHVRVLAEEIGPRNVSHPRQLEAASRYLQEQLGTVNCQVYEADGQRFEILETPGQGPFTVVGAHYDSVEDCPGANDNASGVAAVVELARLLAGVPGLRFVLFPNEEPPYYRTPAMGSVRYVSRLLQEAEPVRSMICLETLGYYLDGPNTQRSPFPGLPTVGNFVALVGNAASAVLTAELTGRWREQVAFPCLGLAPTPASEPLLLRAGMDMSDHGSFWVRGIPAVMVTDTVFYRYPHYHEPEDTWEKLTYEPFARVVTGLATVLRTGLGGGTGPAGGPGGSRPRP